jgi:4-hydroxy-2-oxoheptanedioate aldolase
VLDAGATGILVPHVRTEAEARAIAAAAHYPPMGVRGLATTARAGRHGFTTIQRHLDKAKSETVVLVQIEDADALDNVPAIAAVENVDGVFIGPADLSISLGHPGNPGHPHVASAIETAVRQIRQAGSMPSTFARAPADVAQLAERGIPIAIFSSTLLLHSALTEQMKAIRAGA